MFSGALRVCAVLVASSLGVWLGTGVAAAQSGDDGGQLVTVAARSCPTYEDITANLARNDIQESLRDLGPDTPYVSGEPINPVKEADNQTKCSPITNWRFTLGRGIGGTVKGTWGSLSYVSSPFDTSILTQAQVPMLDEHGRAVPGQVIEGATTIKLTGDQVSDASQHNLWIQGGTTDDPVLDKLYPGTYGFGALRCAIDNLNGDNVEFVQMPNGARHVFCYAYYVVPPPSSGTIVIRKVVRGAPDADESFVMSGNISYDPSGTFTLGVNNGQPAEQTFFRADTGAGVAPWTVTENTPAGWALVGLRCTHGASTVSIDRAAGRADITLAAGDTVTCTYTNTPRPTAGALVLRKITLNDVGSFPFDIRSVAGSFSTTRSITTTTDGVATAAKPIKLSPGSYRINEGAARGSGSRLWRLRGIVCNGKQSNGTVTIAATRGAVCTFTNERTQVGRIAVREVTRGGVGTSGFVISRFQATRIEPPSRYEQQATTQRQNVPRAATGQRTLGIPLGLYVIRQTAVAATQAVDWTLVSVSCDGRLVPFSQGRALVRITSDDPRAICTFTNVRAATPPAPPAPPTPVTPTTPSFPPLPGVTPVVPGGPAVANLAVTKRVDRTSAQVGDIVSYQLTVGNTGATAAEQVVLADKPRTGALLVSSHPSQGTCGEQLPLVCQLGSLGAGATATVRVRLRMTEPGTTRNFAAVGSASTETRLRDNLAVAAAVAVGENPRITGCSASAPPSQLGAQAAC